MDTADRQLFAYDVPAALFDAQVLPAPAADGVRAMRPGRRQLLMSAPVDALQLFSRCGLPGCRNLVADPGHPCDECTSLCQGPDGWRIRQSGRGRPETAVEIDARRDATRDAQLAATLPLRPGPATATERRRNQKCWLCENRRTCTRTSQGWECDECRLL